MPKITYIEHDGTEHLVEVDAGLSLMEGAVNNGVPGIDAECGGSCSCATCHIYVADVWKEKIEPRGEMEEAMLENAENEFTENSRLSCQVEVNGEMDGLVVTMPEIQG